MKKLTNYGLEQSNIVDGHTYSPLRRNHNELRIPTVVREDGLGDLYVRDDGVVVFMSTEVARQERSE